ncbi:hypothetical protein T492DRAFT_1086716 [Pavlovales sp. CCMP2436]|nr:hypothetical protein T492DRAFT_1086716 [Pavlovales sp. CCMP2436]|mmetsp:Transcript_32849/g.81629  ORF Transcript_32849/g.81629 Transcript_32849/m.81629 type:complete len:226 (-) Transcript_32849:53-730(-)|eukprot:CAMPEP_0179841158 /NCGR_PEP_ID=MMETSP0982-20121206/2352_1 /TAXON_ID=483367 /ORGANISM="non described non described, Strain CCMP 2436" /LENGTH=225 /DNA_ID=CAMNT_0021725161 /DNA_START=157 /DNA_END=834 /DNA_ORIENTATION=-
MAAQAVVSSLCENAHTGDLLLFNQRCDGLLGSPGWAAVCAGRKYGLSQSTRGVFDHAGVVVRNPRTGVPWLLEGDARAVKLTPLDERAMEVADTAIDVVLVRLRLRVERSAALEERAQEFVRELGVTDRVGVAVRPSLAQLWRLYDDDAAGSHHVPAAVASGGSADPHFGAGLVAALYARLGFLSPELAARQWTPLGLRSAAFRRCLQGGAELQGEIYILQRTPR